MRDVYLEGYFKERGIQNWDLFNFTAPGTYDWDSVLETDLDNYDLERLKKDTNTHIQNYKNAKLNV